MGDLYLLLGNLKRQYIDHNYFGILFNKNKPSGHKNRSVKRTKGISEIMNVKNLLSPSKELNIMRSMENSKKDKHNKLKKSEALAKHVALTMHTPKLKTNSMSG